MGSRVNFCSFAKVLNSIVLTFMVFHGQNKSKKLESLDSHCNVHTKMFINVKSDITINFAYNVET